MVRLVFFTQSSYDGARGDVGEEGLGTTTRLENFRSRSVACQNYDNEVRQQTEDTVTGWDRMECAGDSYDKYYWKYVIWGKRGRRGLRIVTTLLTSYIVWRPNSRDEGDRKKLLLVTVGRE